MKAISVCVGLLACVVAAAAASSEGSLLRVQLRKRTIDIEEVKASKLSIQRYNALQHRNALLGEAEEADIPLLDFLDAQCKCRSCHAAARRFLVDCIYLHGSRRT